MKLKNLYLLIVPLVLHFPLSAIISQEKYVKPEVYKSNGKVFVTMQVPTTNRERAVKPLQYLKLVTLPAIELDIRGNKVGIENDDLCALVAERSEIVCKSGKMFNAPKKETASSTATPPHLTYDNYIGSYIKITPGPVGSGERVIFLK